MRAAAAIAALLSACAPAPAQTAAVARPAAQAEAEAEAEAGPVARLRAIADGRVEVPEAFDRERGVAWVVLVEDASEGPYDPPTDPLARELGLGSEWQHARDHLCGERLGPFLGRLKGSLAGRFELADDDPDYLGPACHDRACDFRSPGEYATHLRIELDAADRVVAVLEFTRDGTITDEWQEKIDAWVSATRDMLRERRCRP